MRRRLVRAFALAILAGGSLAGCGATGPLARGRGPTRLVPSGPGSAPVEVPLFDKAGVPDSVMLRNHADSGYPDTPAPY